MILKFVVSIDIKAEYEIIQSKIFFQKANKTLEKFEILYDDFFVFDEIDRIVEIDRMRDRHNL